MKKMMMAMLALIVAGTVCQAKIKVSLATTEAVVFADGGSAASTDSLVMYYWSASMPTFDTMDYMNSANGTLLQASSVNNFADSAYDGWLWVNNDAAQAWEMGTGDGYFYSVAFNMPFADYTAGSPLSATLCGVGTISAISDFVDDPLKNQLEYGDILVDAGGFTADQAYGVPEPSTMALGLLGLGALMIRRLRRRG